MPKVQVAGQGARQERRRFQGASSLLEMRPHGVFLFPASEVRCDGEDVYLDNGGPGPHLRIGRCAGHDGDIVRVRVET